MIVQFVHLTILILISLIVYVSIYIYISSKVENFRRINAYILYLNLSVSRFPEGPFPKYLGNIQKSECIQSVYDFLLCCIRNFAFLHLFECLSRSTEITT